MLVFYLSMLGNDNDRNLFERIYYSYRKQMFTVALSVLGNQDDAEDLVHDVFCNIAENHMPTLKNIKNEQDMKNYLLKAAKNSALNKKRDAKHMVSLDGNENFLGTEKGISDSKFLDMICNSLSYHEIISAIRNLDKKYEEVLYLHFVLEMSVPQVADYLNRSKNTVKSQLTRGKLLLLKKISLNGGV